MKIPNGWQLVPTWHLHNMAMGLCGATPDANTQSKEDQEKSLETLRYLSVLYDHYALPASKQIAAEALASRAPSAPSVERDETIECKKCRGWGALGMGGRDGTCPDCGGDGKVSVAAPSVDSGVSEETRAEALQYIDDAFDFCVKHGLGEDIGANEFRRKIIKAAFASLPVADARNADEIFSLADKEFAARESIVPWAKVNLSEATQMLYRRAFLAGYIERALKSPPAEGGK